MERAAELEQVIQNEATPTVENIKRAYEQAIRNINADMSKVARGLSKASCITEDEAKKLLNEAQSREQYKDLIKLYNETENEKVKKDIALKINRQAYGARMTRLEALKQKVYNHLMRAQNVEIAQHKALHADTLRRSYYSNMYNIAKGFDIGINFALLSEKAIDKVLSAKWLGSNYSQRIWNNNQQFIEKVQRTITDGIVAGHSISRMGDKLFDYVAVEGTGQRYIVERLVRSETAHFMAEGQLQSYKESGIEKYQFVAAFSERTCDICGGLDGEIIDVSQARAGDNYPPMHANCRCTTVMAGFNPAARIARDPITGKNYKVDGSMRFSEWKNSLTDEQKAALKYVDKSSGNGIINMRGGSVALENQRYGRNKSTLVNKTYIDSGEYRRKFDNISDNPDVNRTIYNKAKEMLKHRSGTMFEDMYWIDSNTGHVIASALNENVEHGIKASASRDKMIAKKENVIAIHTHPQSMPPSASDFNSYLKNHYNSAYIVCHNGSVFGYTSNEKIDEHLYSAYIESFIKKGNSEFESQWKALEKIKENCLIDFWEVE